MSIIYDALKKIDSIRELNPKPQPQQVASPAARINFFKPVLLLLGIITIGGLVGFLTFRLMPFTKHNNAAAKQELVLKQSSEAPAITNAARVESKHHILSSPSSVSVPLPNLVLNGIFFSGNDGYALVNNQIVQEDDIIEGAAVKHIGVNEVELEFQGSVVKIATKK
ncbi:MAG: hypothetical protein KBA46_07860 [Candidatus Omnitrophica bacterium]|nr:hypothetical protein [Candidatus Omnitrophota bacterium]